MKKMLFILMALVIASPVMAANITISGTGGVLTGQVSYSGGGTGAKPDAARPAGFALVLTASGGAKFLTVTPTRTGVSTAAAPGYGIFPGTIQIDGSGVVTNPGTPVEPNALPGGPSGLNTGRIVVALGALYSGDANKPGAAGNLFSFTTDIACSVTVAVESTYRGGVVGEDAQPMTVTLPSPIVITAAVSECLKNTAPEYAAWVAWGKPNCWCFKKQCNGDINGTSAFGKPVTTADLNVMKLAFNTTDAVLATIANGICADLNHAASFGKRVTTADLNTLKTYFNLVDASVPQCSMTNINFWTN